VRVETAEPAKARAAVGVSRVAELLSVPYQMVGFAKLAVSSEPLCRLPQRRRALECVPPRFLGEICESNRSMGAEAPYRVIARHASPVLLCDHAKHLTSFKASACASKPEVKCPVLVV